MTKLDTAWQAGRLDSSSGPHRLLFGRMYEDAEIERRAFQGKGRLFCIASAGATAHRLADEHEVVACDVNPTQLAYAKRRVDGGPVEIGDAERAMNFARAFMPLVGWRAGVVRAFLALSDITEQMAFWKRHLDTRRFRVGFDSLMSRVILRTVYASQFLSFLPSKFGACFGNGWNEGSRATKTPRTPTPTLSCLAKPARALKAARRISDSCWQTQRPGWNPVPSAPLTASRFPTSSMAQSQPTDHGWRVLSAAQPAERPSSCRVALQNRRQDWTRTTRSAIARCYGEL